MKHIIIQFLTVIFILSAGVDADAKTLQENVQLSRKEKKEAEREQIFQLNREMLDDRNFILEADFLQGRYGSRVHVNSTINFIMVDGEDAVIQIGSNSGFGYNGVGGITARGKITKWELTENEKKKSFNLAMNVVTSIGVYDLHIHAGSGFATARVTGLQPGNLTFSGELVQPGLSRVYEGRSL